MGRNATRWGCAAVVLVLSGCSVSTGGTGTPLTSGAPVSSAQEGDAGSEGSAQAPVAQPGTDAGDSTNAAAPADAPLRLDHLQLRGSHHSYHVAPGIVLDPARNYTQAPLEEQLDKQQVRALELTLHRNGNDLEVYDSAVIDPGTQCQKLSECLDNVRAWSDAHPDHLPVMVWLEVADMAISDATIIDAAVRNALPDDKLLMPSAIQGKHASLREAIIAEGFPAVDSVRGKLWFVLSAPDSVIASYVGSSRMTRALFARASEAQYDAPWAFVTRIDDPMQGASIRAALNSRLIVVSTSCSAAQTDDACVQQRDAGLENGPHVLLDDFPAPVKGRSYWLDMTGEAPARCNPITAPRSCNAQQLGEGHHASSAR